MKRAPITLAALAALLLAACSTPATPGPAPTGTGTGRYPLTLTQPDGSRAVLRARPAKVVTVGNPSLAMDNLLALGIAPVGGEVFAPAARQGGYDARGVPTEVAGQVGAFTPVGTAPGKPDLERIAALHPDLIVAATRTGIGDLPQLEAIAPVVGPPATTPPGTGIESLQSIAAVRALGHVLDRDRQADAFVARFAAAADPVRRAIGGRSADLVSPSADGSTFFWFGADAQPTGHLLAYLGLTLATTFPADGRRVAAGDYSYSTERAGALTAQYLVLGVRPSAYPAFLANPLVARLPSVTAGRVIRTTGRGEGFGDGSLVAGAMGQLAALPAIGRAFTTTGVPPS